MIDTSTWATLTSPACLVLAPANLGLRPDLTPAPDSDLTFMASAVAIVEDVPVSTILTHRPRTLHLRAEVQRTADSLDEVLEQGPVAIAGASGARWVRGHWVLEEALTEAGHELLPAWWCRSATSSSAWSCACPAIMGSRGARSRMPSWPACRWWLRAEYDGPP